MSRPTLADLTEPEFWLYIGLGGIGFAALVIVLNAIEAFTLAVLAVGMVFGWLMDRIQRPVKDRIDARRDDAADSDGEVRG